MIRLGTASDKTNAVALYKATEDDTHAAGLILAGFGTQPPPGVICDDGIQRAVNFAAYYLQKALELLVNKQCADMETAKEQIGTRLSKLNDSISYISRHLGQGIYLSGTVCYVAGDQYICQSFGNAYACLWNMNKSEPLSNTAPEEEENAYITDAIGGCAVWTPNFSEGVLPIGSQLLCMTQRPPENLLPCVMSELIRTNHVVLPVSIYKGLERNGTPLAVLTVAQAADYRRVISNE